MKTILEKLEALKAADRKGKDALLKDYMENELFKKFVTYTLDTSKTYGVSSVKRSFIVKDIDLFEYLDILSKQKGVTKKDKETLASIASFSDEQFLVTNKILRGNMDCSVSIDTIDRLFPGLVPYFPYMRCKGYDHIAKIDFSEGAFSQLKANGMYANVFVEEGGVKLLTRNGKELHMRGGMDSMFQNVPVGWLLMGELTVVDGDEKDIPRAQGNAIITKAIDGAISDDEIDKIRFTAWDMIPTADWHKRTCNTPYHLRLTELANICGGSGFDVIESKLVYSLNEAQTHYKEIRARYKTNKLEGTVVKNLYGIWFDGDSYDQIKVKNESVCEMECIGTEAGKVGGKNADRIGSLVVKSSCGKLVGRVSGLSDEDRNQEPEYFIGKIVGVRLNDLSKNKNKDVRSFDHAQYDGIRIDKSTADTLEYVEALINES